MSRSLKRFREVLNLAKCPHCDGHRVLRSVCYGEGHFVKGDCPHCHSCWPFKPTEEEAIIAANVGCWLPIGEHDGGKEPVDLWVSDGHFGWRTPKCRWTGGMWEPMLGELPEDVENNEYKVTHYREIRGPE